MNNSTFRSDTRNPPLFLRVLKCLLSVVGKVTVTGAEHLGGPVGKVIVCNHVGWMDPLWIGYAVLPRTLHQMAKKELFDNPISSWFVRSGGGFPVERGRPSASSIKHAVSLVEQGDLVLVFLAGRAAATMSTQNEAQRQSRCGPKAKSSRRITMVLIDSAWSTCCAGQLSASPLALHS
ncbi:lysophospholipid acyltransferase family protein [Cupriavidus basilensis]